MVTKNSPINKVILYNDFDLISGKCGDNVKYARDYDIPKVKGGRYKPVFHGLYDPHIFGYKLECKCPRAYRQKYTGTKVKCKTCGCWVMSEDEYESEYTLYKLNAPYVNFLKVDALVKEVKKIFGQFPNGLDSRIKGVKSGLQALWSLYLYTEDRPFELESLGKNGDKITTHSIKFFDGTGKEVHVILWDLPGIDASDIPKKDLRGHPIDVDNMGLFGLKKLSKLFFSGEGNQRAGDQCNILGDLTNYQLVVTSPGRASRRASIVQMDGSEKLGIGPETENYYAIMNYNKCIANYLKNPYLSITDKATYCWYMNVMINAHFSDNELLQGSKQSLTRTIMDTRVEASLRALIVADLELPMDTVGLPETFVYATLRKHVINELQQRLTDESGMDTPIESAVEMYDNNDPIAHQVLKELVEVQYDDYGNELLPQTMCKLTRNPTLHKWNIQSLKIKLVNDTAIHLPTALDEGYNADH